LELVARCAPARPARPSSQTGRRRAGSVAPRRTMGYRRDADLCARHGRSRPALARVTTQWPAVRMLARGGGGGTRQILHRSPCLTQRRERRGRVDGLAHQLAERALGRAACGRRGEHVFGRLRRAPDGTRTLRDSACRAARIWLCGAQIRHEFLQSILHIGRGRTGAEQVPRGSGPGGPAGTRAQSASSPLTPARPPTPRRASPCRPRAMSRSRRRGRCGARAGRPGRPAGRARARRPAGRPAARG
jgi:hypothetical protein